MTENGLASNGLPLTIETLSLPPVTQVQPANGSTGFPENGRVIVRLAQPVQAAAIIPGTVTVSQGTTNIAGNLALSNDGLSVTFTPSQNLAANTTLSVAVTDLAGNQTTAAFQSSFTTGSSTDTISPTVVTTNPQNDQSSVPISAPIVFQFSKPMDPATLTPQDFIITDEVTGNSVPGMVQVDPTGTIVSFVPQGFLGVGRTFSVELESWLITDSSGNNLTGSGTYFAFTASFAADSTGPQLLGSFPANAGTSVPLNAVIVLEFNKPLDVISVSNGLEVQAAGQFIAGAIAVSGSNQRVTFTPMGGLAPNTSYTVTTTSQITDVGGLSLTDPGSFSFITGSVNDNTTLSVTSVSPSNNESGVPVNTIVQLQFNKAVDPWTVTPATLQLTSGTSAPFAGTVSVSPDGLMATFTPSQQLSSFTDYYITASGISDMEGNLIWNSGSSFSTGVANEGSGPTITSSSPPNGANNVPANPRVDLTVSAQVDVASVNSNSIILSAGGTAVPGTATLNIAGTTLTFVPSSLLAANTSYSVAASGFTDQSGNAVVPFTSNFTTGSSPSANTTTPSVLTVNPANGASSVSVGGAVVLTFNEAIDVTTANETNVPVSVNGVSGVIAGSYSLDSTGTVLTFTPLAPLPSNATITVQVNSGLADLSGNPGSSFSSTFSTGAATGSMAPTVTMITPQNGATGMGLNGTVVLTFSESLNSTTINTSNFGMLANGNEIPIGISNSADNRVVTLNPFGLPPSSSITVLATSGVTDLSGNSLANFQSQFTTGSGLNTQSPAVVEERPGNGATGVPLNTNIVVYLSQPMNPSTIPSALEVSQNGVLVTGTTQVTENGQVVQFTPSSQWQPSALVQVFLTSAAQSVTGLSAASYQGSFTTVPNTSTTAPSLVGTNPANNASNVPTNTVMDFSFNEPLDPTALLPGTVTCNQNGIWIQTAVAVMNSGLLLQVTPRFSLAPNSSTICVLGSGIQGTNGLPLWSYSANQLAFTTGAGPDTVVPTVLTTSPPNGSSNVGDNGNILFVFSKPINPLTVNANSIQITGSGQTDVPDSITFSNNNQSVLLLPHAPLPDGTQMTLTLSGVTDVAGNSVVDQTTQFTTGTGPDLVPPFIVSESPFQNAQGVPLNAVVILQMSQAIDPGTVNSATLTLTDNSNGQIVAGSASLSSDGLTITFVPGAPLTASTSYSVNFPGAGFGSGISDLSGNSMLGGAFSFTTGVTTSTSAPAVTGTSPSNGATAIPTNAQVVIQFNEPINPVDLNGVTLAIGGAPVNISTRLTNGDQRLILSSVAPLSPGTTYVVTISGVQDFSGNILSSPVTLNFTTGTGPDLSLATVATVNPSGNATGVSPTTNVTVTFSKAIDPLTVTTSTMQLVPTSTYIPVSGTVSTTGQTATFTPSQSLDLLTQYNLSLSSGVTDMEGQTLNSGSYNSAFTTSGGTPTGPPTIASIPGGAGGQIGGSVQIDGTYFGISQGGSTVTFNGIQATTTNWSDTQITATVPSGATSGPVVVTVSGAASNGFNFTVFATPTVTGISPTIASAGTQVTVTGANLGDSLDSVLVYFTGGQIAPVSANETSLTWVVPLNAQSGTVTVLVNGSMSSSGENLTVIPTPSVTQVSPNIGVAGSLVSISGSNFGDTQGSSSVNFNGVPASSTVSWSNNAIQVLAPSNVSTGPLTVTVNSITSNSNLVYTVTNPVITGIVPSAAAPGGVITISGQNLQPAETESYEVLFNGVAVNPGNFSYTSIVIQVPSNATSGPVTVVINGVSSNAVNFSVIEQPTITSISPSVGPFDSNGLFIPVTITGTGFGPTQSNTTVNFFGSVTQPQIINWSDTSIELWVPLDAATGPVYVQVGGLNAISPTWFYRGTPTQLTDSMGNQTQYNFVAQGGAWVPSSQGPGCVTCSMRGNITNTADANGNILTTVDDMGNATNYTYDGNNDVASVSKPLNSTTSATTSYTYNSFGEVVTMTDPLGNVTTNTYDSHGNLLTVTAPQPNNNTSPSLTQFQYATNGELTQITDPNGNVTKLTYNSVGLIASITDAQNNVTTYQYDSLGDRTAVIDPVNGASHPTTFSYDAMSRLLGITYPDGSTVSFTYDIRGRRTSSTDQNGKTTTYTYDDADRLTAVTDPANHATQYAYDTEDNLLSITDANGHATQFAYNARGWVTQTTFPSSLTESYTYDLVGNLLSKTDRKNNTIQYVYDALYRLTNKLYPDQTAVDYAYDLAGKVLQVSDPTGAYGFAYDNMGRLIGTTTQYAWLPSITESNSYTYDAASNRTSLTAPDGSITTYGYDTLNRLNGLANSWAGSFGFSYDALSRRTQLTRPNGITTNYAYDSVSHLLSVLHQAGLNTLDGAGYTYDAAGNRTAKTNYQNGITSTYSYDPLYELTQVTQGTSTTESYSYDAVGNRLSSSGVPTYNYNASNELTSNSAAATHMTQMAIPSPTPPANPTPGTSRTAWRQRWFRASER